MKKEETGRKTRGHENVAGAEGEDSDLREQRSL